MFTAYVIGTILCIVGVSILAAVEDYKDHIDNKRPLDFFRFFDNVMPGICLAFMWPGIVLFGILAIALSAIVGIFMAVMWLFYTTVCWTIEHFQQKTNKESEDKND